MNCVSQLDGVQLRGATSLRRRRRVLTACNRRAVMLSLPVSFNIVEINGITLGQWSSLTVSNSSVPQGFTAPGLDRGTIGASSSVAKAVTFQ